MFYDVSTEGYILRIRVTPNSSRCGVSGVFTDCADTVYLKINLNAVPEKGKANTELIKFLSKTLKYPKSAFSIISGETDRCKKIALNIPHSVEIEQTLNNMENPL